MFQPCVNRDYARGVHGGRVRGIPGWVLSASAVVVWLCRIGSGSGKGFLHCLHVYIGGIAGFSSSTFVVYIDVCCLRSMLCVDMCRRFM